MPPSTPRGFSLTVDTPEPACDPPLLDHPEASFAAKGSSFTVVAPEPACEPLLLDHTLWPAASVGAMGTPLTLQSTTKAGLHRTTAVHMVQWCTTQQPLALIDRRKFRLFRNFGALVIGLTKLGECMHPRICPRENTHIYVCVNRSLRAHTHT